MGCEPPGHGDLRQRRSCDKKTVWWGQNRPGFAGPANHELLAIDDSKTQLCGAHVSREGSGQGGLERTRLSALRRAQTAEQMMGRVQAVCHLHAGICPFTLFGQNCLKATQGFSKPPGSREQFSMKGERALLCLVLSILRREVLIRTQSPLLGNSEKFLRCQKLKFLGTGLPRNLSHRKLLPTCV